MVIATISFFDDEPELLARALLSVSGADRIIAVDGTYADWPHNGKFRSSNEVLDVVRSFRDVELIEANDKPYPHQIDKRNAYLLGNEGDWYVNVDADEELRFHGQMDWPAFKAMLESLPPHAAWVDVLLTFRPDLAKGSYWTGRRVFRHIPGLHYAEHHARLWDMDGNRTALEQGENTKGQWYGVRNLAIEIYHNKLDRTKERNHLQGHYYRTREHP